MTTQPNAHKKAARKTKAQKRAHEFLELYGIVHYLLTEGRCPVIFDGKLAHVRCPGVSKEAFRQAIEKRVINNLVAYVNRTVPPKATRRQLARLGSKG